MVAASILPVASHKGKLYFLFGKENEMEDSAPGFSDFGGGVEKDESIMDTAIREGSEELCGFLGDSTKIRALLKGGMYPLIHDTYHIHMFVMAYDENLPCYFTNHHRFLWQRMDKKLLNDSKYFEKQEIRWFSVEDMKKDRKLFRGFYREIVDTILKDIKGITAFVKNNKRGEGICSLSKTRRQRKKGG
jgi:8-oxo-dGTP pyrophosphatase MutT (NUDIX family)